MNGKTSSVLLLVLAVASALPKPKPQFPFGHVSNRRIVGGSEATPHSSPWIVDMRQGGGHYCGGSIITSEWVVTAAHCSTSSASAYQLVAGDHNIATIEPEQQSRQVDMVIQHPSYGSGVQYQYDIALMHVSPPFVLNDIVKPIELPPIPGMASGPVVAVTGWGALTQGGGSPDTLYTVDVPFVDDQACRNAYGADSISDDMFCAGEAGKDSCQGDSGGPLTCSINGTTYLCGIVSWGMGCAQPGYPGVYTEASYFKDWVLSSIVLPEEDNSTFVEQNEGCGGSLVGTSGQVSYMNGVNEKCTWSLRANDQTAIRVEVYELGNLGDRLYLTQLDTSNGQLSRTIEITEVGVYNVSGPIVFLTLESDDEESSQEGFRLHFYGTAYPGATRMILSNVALNGASGTVRHPANGGDYQSDELATIVINPGDSSTLTFNNLDLEGGFGGDCMFDMVNVHTHQNGEFGLSGTYCGDQIPPSHTSDGPIIITFMSDFSGEYGGFQVSWA